MSLFLNWLIVNGVEEGERKWKGKKRPSSATFIIQRYGPDGYYFTDRFALREESKTGYLSLLILLLCCPPTSSRLRIGEWGWWPWLLFLYSDILDSVAVQKTTTETWFSLHSAPHKRGGAQAATSWTRTTFQGLNGRDWPCDEWTFEPKMNLRTQEELQSRKRC